jgi:predicted Zn finger-like uncharacterized protein
VSGLITRCHVCATAFRVQRAQLAARGGKVRCGKCGTVFDGIAGLVEEGPELLRLEPSPQLGLFDPGRRPPRGATPSPAADDEDAPLPEFLVREEEPRRLWLWSLAVLLAAAVLLAQAAYRYRTEIAVLVPEARAPLETACRAAGCTVPLPRRPDLIGIDSSDLQAEGRESVIVLNALLRNRAPFPQQYPSLELTLTDDADRPVVRRVLAPEDYLGPARAVQQAATGIAPGAEMAVRVSLDASRTQATGYRLYLFFPQ